MLCPRMALPTRIEFCPHARENSIQAILIVLIEAVAVVVDELRNTHGDSLLPPLLEIDNHGSGVEIWRIGLKSETLPVSQTVDRGNRRNEWVTTCSCSQISRYSMILNCTDRL